MNPFYSSWLKVSWSFSVEKCLRLIHIISIRGTMKVAYWLNLRSSCFVMQIEKSKRQGVINTLTRCNGKKWFVRGLKIGLLSLSIIIALKHIILQVWLKKCLPHSANKACWNSKWGVLIGVNCMGVYI